MRVDKEALEILKNVYRDVLIACKIPLDYRKWELSSEHNMSEYVFFNEYTFLAVFPICQKSSYADNISKNRFTLKARMPARATDRMADEINSRFINGDHLISWNQLVKNVKKEDLEEMLKRHSKDNKAVSMFVEQVIYSSESSDYFEATIIDETDNGTKKQSMLVSDESFIHLKDSLTTAKQPTEQFTVDLSNDPEALRRILEMKDSGNTRDGLKIIEELIRRHPPG